MNTLTADQIKEMNLEYVLSHGDKGILYKKNDKRYYLIEKEKDLFEVKLMYVKSS